MFIGMWIRLIRTMIRGVVEDPAFRVLVIAVVWLMILGTGYFALIESWSVVNSFYFTVSTLTTVGYGDIVPTSDGAKLATVALQLSGIGVFVLLLSEVAKRSLREKTAPTAGGHSEAND